MKKMLDNKGIGGKEAIAALLLILVIIAIAVTTLSGKTNDKGYKAMKMQAENFVKAISVFKDRNTKDSGIYYLYELEGSLESIDLFDPDNKHVKCNGYESLVDLSKGKHVTLRCGSYLIDGEYQKNYNVFQIGEWQKESVQGDTAFLYNIKVDDKLVFSEYYPEIEFVGKYNASQGTAMYSLEDCYADAKNKPNLTIESELLYREKKLVKEF
jgi:hypothetical protein